MNPKYKSAVIVFCFYGLFLSACDEVDTCLDRGGAWDVDANKCIFSPAADAGYSDGDLKDDA